MKLPSAARRFCLLAALFAGFLVACSFGAGATAASDGYTARIAAARAFAAEGSWALARDTFAQALALAPDEEARHWARLWLDEAVLRALDPQAGAGRAQAWAEHRARVDPLLQLYKNGGARDALWAALTEDEANWIEYSGHGDAWELRRSVAEMLALQPPEPENATRLADFLQRALTTGRRVDWIPAIPDPAFWRGQLRLTAQALREPTRRAWCLLEVAELSVEDATLLEADRVSALAAAESAARGTRWEVPAQAFAFAWRSARAQDVDGPPGSRPDFRGRVQRAEVLIADLQGTAPFGGKDALLLRLRELRDAWAKPRLTVFAPSHLSSDTPLSFGIGSSGIHRLRMELYRLSPAGYTAKAGARRGWEWKPDGAPVWSLEKVFADSETLGWGTDVVGPADRLKSGLYTLVVRSVENPGVQFIGDLLVSDVQAAVVAAPSGQVTLLFQSSRTLRAAAGAELTGVLAVEGKNQAFSGRTDGSGAFTFELADGLAGNGVLAGTVGGQAFACSIYLHSRPLADPLVADVFVDRPLFQPGETAHWKLILRQSTGHGFRVPDRTGSLSWSVRLGNETLLPETPVELSPLGTASGEVKVPATARPGEAVLQFRTSRNGKDISVRTEELFAVDRYRPPPLRLKLTLASPPESLRPGGALRLRARLAYLSGGPAAGVPVHCRLEPQLFRPWQRQSSETLSTSWKPLQRELAATTDAEGTATFSLSLPSELPERIRLSAHASAAPEGGVEVHDSLWLTVSRGALLVEPADAHAQLSAPGETAVFRARILDGALKAAPFRGWVELVEERWIGLWLDGNGKVNSEPPLPGAVATMLHDGWASVPIARQEASAGPDGRLETAFRLPHSGIFRLKVLAGDGETPLQLVQPPYGWRTGFDGQLAVVAAAAEDRELALPPGESFLFGSSPSAEAGARRLLCVLPEHAPYGVLTVSDARQGSVQRVNPRGRLAWTNLPALKPGAAYRAELAAPDSVPAAFLAWSEPDPSHRLDLQIQPQSAEAKPGESAGITFHLADASGRPQSGEIAVAVTDEAVNGLVKKTNPAPRFLVDRGVEPEAPFVVFTPAPKAWIAVSPQDPRPGAIVAGGGEGFFPLEDSATGMFAEATLAGARLKSSVSLPAADTVLAEERGMLIRRHFESTAFWDPNVKVGENGAATVTFTYPDNLTEWRIEAYAVGGDGASFAREAAFARTTLPFQARLQTPGFLVAGDRAELSALAVNRTDAKLEARLSFTAGAPLEGAASEQVMVAVDPRGDTRQGWTVTAAGAGEATLLLEGRSPAGNDGMHLSLPVIEDGVVQHTAFSGQLRAGEPEHTFTLPLPDPLDPARAHAIVQVSSSRAAVVLDALPFLIDYPYGCVEQTMSRFFPAVAVEHALQRLGIAPSDLDERLRRETESRGQGPLPGWKSLAEVVHYGLARLAQAQRGDGSFGWWPDSPEADLWMTSYVAWGLAVAGEGGVEVPSSLVESTRGALVAGLSTGADADAKAFALAALARGHVDVREVDQSRPAYDALYRGREKLGPEGRACLALASAVWGTDEQRAVLRNNLENGAQRAKSDDAGDTVHWGATEAYLRSRDGAVECTALTLLALLRLSPDDERIEPAANWLVLNRRSARWTSTRDTAFAVLALTDLLATHEERDTDAEVDVELDGYSVGRVRLNRAALLQGTQEVVLPGNQLKPGSARIGVRRTGGTGPVYVTALSSAWARADAVKPAGHLLSVDRDFVRRVPQPTLSGVVLTKREDLGSSGAVKAGEQVDARLRIEVPNDLEYLMISVPRPAGCEALNPLSGWDARLLPDLAEPGGPPSPPSHAGTPLYREEHDTRSVFFIRSLPAGKWLLRFGLRAVTPGDYRVLPAEVQAMYVPEVAANSDARRIAVRKP